MKKVLNEKQKEKSLIDTSAERMVEAINEIKHQKFIDKNEEFAKKVIAKIKKVDERLRKKTIENLRSKKSITTKADANDIFNEKQAVETYENELEKILIEIAVTNGILAMADLPTINPFDPKSETLLKEVKRILKLHATAYTDTTARQIMKKLIQAGKDGLTTYEMESVVSEVFKQGFRHERLGQNLTFAIANKGSLEAYKQSGVVRTKV